MVIHHNPTITQDTQRILNLKIGESQIVGNDIIPVIPITRVCNIVRSATRTTTGSSTLITTSTDRDFYIVACQLAIAYDVNSDATSYTLSTTIDGVNRELLHLRKLSGATLSDVHSISISFPIPIKIDRGAQVFITQTFSLGTNHITGVVHGYEVATQTTTAQP